MQDIISVIIADAHFLSRVGLKKLLANLETFKLIGEATNENELSKLLKAQQPDILIIDYYHPGHFNESSINKIKSLAPNTHILVISGVHDKKSIYQVLEQGVHSFLTKTCGKTEVLDAIQATAKGEKFFCTRIVDYLLEKSFAKTVDCSPSPLTPREIEIVQLVAKGLIAKEIASRLNLSPHTIYTHRKNIMRKLKLNTSSELVLYAVNNGFVLEEN